MTLRNFLREASRHAEAIFDPEDQMLAHIIAEGRDGKVSVFVCPMQDAAEEAMFRIGIPAKLRASGEYRWWCFFTEAWQVAAEQGETHIQPKLHPRRVEIVLFQAESRTGDKINASRQIWRGDGSARLLPLIVSDREARFFPCRD